MMSTVEGKRRILSCFSSHPDGHTYEQTERTGPGIEARNQPVSGCFDAPE